MISSSTRLTNDRQFRPAIGISGANVLIAWDGLCQPAGRHQPAQHPGAGLHRHRLRLRQRRLWRPRRQRPRRHPVPERHRRRRDLADQQRRRGVGHRLARLAAGRLQDRRHRQLQQHARRRHPAAQQRRHAGDLADQRHRGRATSGARLTSPAYLNAGIGDFTGDGQSDLLFRNDAPARS